VINKTGSKKKMYPDMTESNPSSRARTEIDENLKRIYDETMNQAIPDRLTALLDQLRRQAANEEDTVKPADAPPNGLSEGL